jgi:membrane protease YdiL (CAAX protease family)
MVDASLRRAELAASLVPIGLLTVGAAVPILRLPVLIVLSSATVVGIGRDAWARWVWAAALPVAVSLAWGTIAPPVTAGDGSDCASPASPVAAWRAAEAVVVLVVLGGLGVALRAGRGSLLLRWPARGVAGWAVLGFLASGPLAFLVGPLLARPFFGPIGYDATFVGAIPPALIFAISNGVMEELIYRGALLGWSARVIGTRPALIGQALVFGVAHSGADVIAGALPLMLALGAGGLITGVIALRTRSLMLPMAVHIGLDLPIYYAFACASGAG